MSMDGCCDKCGERFDFCTCKKMPDKFEKELAACPFCGYKMFITGIGKDWWRLEGEHDESCPLYDFEINVPMKDNAREQLIKDWNTRFKPQYETPEQYFQRTGKVWPDDGIVWILFAGETRWKYYEYGEIRFCEKSHPVICATETGKPPEDWRPE